MFLVASILCAAAPTLPWFLAGRALQGIGAACLMPSSLAILGASFSRESRGPLIGGWLVESAGWRTIFLLNLPFGGAAARRRGWAGAM